MITPQEIEVWYILPAIRRELTISLKEEGLKQREVSEILGVTESAVSQYIKSKRARKVIFGTEIMKEVKKSAKRLAKGKHAMPEIQRLVKVARRHKIVCNLNETCACEKDVCKVCLR